MSRKEKLLRENYKINEKEYYHLLYGESRSIFDLEKWSIFYKWVGIHKKLNNLFQDDPFIFKLIFSPAYSSLLTDKNEYGCIGELTSFSFDHTSSMQLRSDVSKINGSDTVTGIVTFPYFHNWEGINNWIDKVPEDNFSVYIINPILIYYGPGTVGLFLTPKYCGGYVIELCNRYIISLTGYPLFLTFSSEENVERISYVDLELSVDDFINELYESGEKSRSLLKVLNFWKENDDVSIPSVDENYECYMDVQPYHACNDLNFMKIISKKPFKLVHEDTKKVLGTFKEFSLDAPFKVIDTENGEFKLSQSQVDDLLNGKYDFIIEK